VLLLLAACAVPEPAPSPEAPTTAGGPLGEPQGRWRDQMHRVPMLAANGQRRFILMRFCRPPIEAAAPLALVNHGAPVDRATLAGMVATRCDSEAVRWFLEHGFAVGVPLRRGFGASGGTYVESLGRCDQADPAASAEEVARDVQGALDYARALPGVDAARPAVVVGQSAGGWGGLALASHNPAGVGALVNMAAGRGGWAMGRANTVCRPDLLVADAGRFGAKARAPALFVYAENDTFFGPELAARLVAAYAAGGAPAELKQLPPWGRDGHGLFFGQFGSETWGPLVADFLQRQGAMP
jgi:pimeloyl-ACP methyl ester carboxylesterase